jgi:hypothetical protein
MAIKNRNTLKTWFETGDYPTQQQFWDWLDSYLHLQDDKLPIDNVEGLRALLNAKAENELFNLHLQDKTNPHAVTKEQVGLGNIPNVKSNAIDEDNSEQLATSAAVYSLNRLLDKLKDKEDEVDFETDGTYEMEKGDLLETIVVLPTEDTTLHIGTTAGADDILIPMEFPAGSAFAISLNVYADKENKLLYISGITSAVTIKFYKR